jgi:hypothetical protein
MAIHYSSGFGKLYDKETGETILNINYQLIETDQTIYTNKKWWGEFSVKQEIELDSMYIIEFADSRKGECIVTTDSERKPEREKTASNHYYRFYGRGRLGWRL